MEYFIRENIQIRFFESGPGELEEGVSLVEAGLVFQLD